MSKLELIKTASFFVELHLYEFPAQGLLAVHWLQRYIWFVYHFLHIVFYFSGLTIVLRYSSQFRQPYWLLRQLYSLWSHPTDRIYWCPGTPVRVLECTFFLFLLYVSKSWFSAQIWLLASVFTASKRGACKGGVMSVSTEGGVWTLAGREWMYSWSWLTRLPQMWLYSVSFEKFFEVSFVVFPISEVVLLRKVKLLVFVAVFVEQLVVWSTFLFCSSSESFHYK